MTNFHELNLNPQILSALDEMGFVTPTEIQQQAIPVFLKQEHDLIALAQTGTGKTAAFGLPIIHNISVENRNTQALIISPTRELCVQITNDLFKFSKNIKGLKVLAVYGGASIMQQMRDIKAGVHIIVATPGRLIDLLKRKAVHLENVHTVVLDEADEMLNMGFQEDMEEILSHTPKEKITGLFSATMPKEIRRIANTYLNNPQEITVGTKNTAQKNITHQYSVVQAKDKRAALRRIIDFNEDFYGIVFCQTKIETQDVSDLLIKNGYSADCLHGDLSQQQRDKVMSKFRHKTIQILLATDVAARGIDVSDLTHVIHYHLPDEIENYTHRSGRTARAGKKGISIALLHIREAYKLHQIEKIAEIKFEKFLIPNGADVLNKRINNFIQTFKNYEVSDDDVSLQNEEWVKPLMELTKEELIQKLMAMELRKFSTEYLDSPDLNIEESRSSRGSESSSRDRNSSRNDSRGRSDNGRGRNDRGNSRGGDRDRGAARGGDRDRGGDRNRRVAPGDDVRMFISLGKKDDLRYDEMRDMIFNATKVTGKNIKDIEMKGVYSFFNTDKESAEKISQKFNDVKYKGRDVRIQFSEDQKSNSYKRNDGDRGENSRERRR